MKNLSLWNADKYGRMASLVDAKLDKFNAKHNGLGVKVIRIDECWSPYYGNTALLYVNMGNTYTKTLCYSPITGKFYRSDWGGLVEELLPKYIWDRIF